MRSCTPVFATVSHERVYRYPRYEPQFGKIIVSTEDLLRQEGHFAFGKNWLDYAEKIDESKVEQAMRDLCRLAERERLGGLSFLDIGCGSGLSSLAALRLGAVEVVGVDLDPDSVAAARLTLERFAPGATWRFDVFSVFDMDPVRFGEFDIVYSWGVLHHTGDMVRAIESAARLVRPGGELWLALYGKTPFCRMWRGIKRWYSRATPAGQARARKLYVGLVKLGFKLQGRDFEAHVVSYGKKRGMNFYNDVHDWLGGYPYESISPADCHALMDRLGFVLEREFIHARGRYLPGLFGAGCDEYVFRRSGTG